MMNQIYSNAADPLKGRQLPIMYSSKAFGFFSDLRQPRHPVHQAVGWAMASAYKGDDKIAVGLDRRRLDRGGRLPPRPDLRRRLSRAGDPQHRQQPVGDLQLPRASRAASARPSRRAAIGYGLPALRVDGNDFLAVYAATQWAAERARANLGRDADRAFHLSRRGPLHL